MQEFQKPIIDKKMNELIKIANNIDKLKLSKKWTIIFTKMCCYRCWKQLNKTQQSQMKNISEIDSNTIEYLVIEKYKKAGLDLIEMVAVEITEESERRKAVNILLTKGAKEGYQDVLLLVADAKRKS